MAGNPPYSQVVVGEAKTQAKVAETDTPSAVSEPQTKAPILADASDSAPVGYNPKTSWTWDTTKIRFDMTGFRWDGTHHPADGWF